MRSAATSVTAVVAAAAMTGLSAAPAAADGVVVSPGAPHPGQKIHISVPGCSVGPTPHTARSNAFRHPVTLFGKADTGEADPRLRKDLRPGTYPVTASCGDRTVHGQVVVIAGAGPAGAATSAPPGPPAVHTEAPMAGRTTTVNAHPAASHGAGGPRTAYWLAGAAVALLAGGAGLLALRRRRTP